MRRYQRTINAPVHIDGVGVHSGEKVNLTIKPAECNHGIRFKRVDLKDSPGIPAHFNMVVDTSLATVIGYNGFIVSTIEHLMASLSGMSVDNALVEMDAHEVPIMDGSAAIFTGAIKKTGTRKQKSPRCIFQIKTPICLYEGDKSVCAYPAPTFKITSEIEYENPLIGRQSYTAEVNEDVFEKEVCRARTFGFLEDHRELKMYGLGLGSSLDNAVVIGKDGLMNKEGLRYNDEFVRHKMLDSLGDFSLLGLPIMGHIITRKSGHNFNHKFIRKFFSDKSSWETRILGNEADSTPMQPKSLAV